SSEASRKSTFEATLRVLDENPTYVDELFAQAMRHPRTLDRFVADTSARLDEPELSNLTARHLAEQPAALEQILVATQEAAQSEPKAQAAIARAIERRAKLGAAAISKRPSAV